MPFFLQMSCSTEAQEESHIIKVKTRNTKGNKAGTIPRPHKTSDTTVTLSEIHTKLQCKCLCPGKCIYSSPSFPASKQYYFTIILQVKFLLRVCSDLWDFGQGDKLTTWNINCLYIYLFIQPYPGKIAVFYASYRKLQKSSKCNKKGKSGEKSSKISFTAGGGMGVKPKQKNQTGINER